MPRLSARSSTPRQHEGERVFADDMGRLWLAAQTSDAIVTCISDGRGSARALAVEAARLDASVGDDTLARGSIKPRASALCRESS